MQSFVRKVKLQGKTVGFVPTMGYLHEGHISLVHASKKENDVTIVSIFVNPTQFAPNEDFTRYPRDLKRDLQLLQDAGADVVFTPDAGEMYPPGSQTFVSVDILSTIAEGEFRPTHFKGVTTVVNMLFTIVQPDKSYFGQKDAQQTAVIRRMVKDLHMPVQVVVCPIMRDPDGLAMSSRNIFLSESERKKALTLSKSLHAAKALITSGNRSAEDILAVMEKMFQQEENLKPDYIRIVDAESFTAVQELNLPREYFIIIACKVGSTRLIDNTLVSVEADTVTFR